jgi:4-hydroxythreonine-4-phosphate dehydrogenase
MRRPRVAITTGDPAGIGPEIAARAAADERVRAACEPVVYAPPIDRLFVPGRLSADAGKTAYDIIVRAVEDAREQRVDAIATAPVNKEAFRLAGLPWRGHTDLLAHLTDARQVAMMFFSDALRVVLATVHVPLADVPALLTRGVMEATIALTAQEMPRFGFPRPRIAAAGLNPHAGEHGLFGREEETALAPAIAACRATGIDVSGPFPADTIFVRARRGDPAPPGALAEAAATYAGEPAWDAQIAITNAEVAWLDGRAGDVDAVTADAVELAVAGESQWAYAELLLWRHRSGLDVAPERQVPEAIALELDGRHAEAAAAWDRLGCPYEAAMVLCLAGDEGSMASVPPDLASVREAMRL